MATRELGEPPTRFKLVIPDPCEVSEDMLRAMAQPPLPTMVPNGLSFAAE